MWPKTGNEVIAPPAVRRLPGRPKLNRKKDKDEPKKVGKLSKQGQIITYRICNTPGHNKRGCPQRSTEVIIF